MTFSGVQEAYLFYCRYAKAVGFGVKKFREKPHCKWINCTREGKCASRSPNNPKVRKKGTRRTGCNAGIKLKKILHEDDRRLLAVSIDLVNLDHNHAFLQSNAATNHFHCHKQREPEMLEFVGAMQDSRVPHHCILDMMSEMHDGTENMPMTLKDIQNMYVTDR